MKPLTPGKLICVFGCGGDRDKTKRPIMGRLAAELADRLVLTSDNPRSENPERILAEIFAGIEKKLLVKSVVDRKQAIEEALNSLQPGDCLLVAGKGHEDYQIIGKEKKHFSDQEVIQNWMTEKKLALAVLGGMHAT